MNSPPSGSHCEPEIKARRDAGQRGSKILTRKSSRKQRKAWHHAGETLLPCCEFLKRESIYVPSQSSAQ